MKYDDILTNYLNGFGPYQKRIYILMCLPGILCAFHMLAIVFIEHTPEYRCLLPFEEYKLAHNGSFNRLSDEINDRSFPLNPNSDEYSKCEYFDINFNEIMSRNVQKTNVTKKCDRWIYDETEVISSIVTEWDLVCDRSIIKTIIDVFFMVGFMIGSFLCGNFSDKYGRKKVYFISLILMSIFGILTSFATGIVSYTIYRMVVGASVSGVFLSGYVMAIEFVDPQRRTIAGIVCMIFFSLGYILLALIAYHYRTWRSLQIVISLPTLLFLLYWKIAPESIRWLIANGKIDEAIILIKKIAKFNRVNIPASVYSELKDSSSQPKAVNSASVFDLLKYPNLRKRTLIIFYAWFVNSLTYYGLSWNSLGDNLLVNFLISGIVELPAQLFLLVTLNHCGRRIVLSGTMIFSGLMLYSVTFIPQSYGWLVTVFAMLGKMAITASYIVIYIVSSEQFPTVLRNVGLGTSSLVARIGGILTPLSIYLGKYWRPLPLIIFGVQAFLCGLLTLLLPETLNKRLADTVKEGEAFGCEKTNSYEEKIPLIM
uniref:Putative synaptic vesicle transporter svop n=1 Tax=Corethrella appendiculata TaxID=1370023 RepID=U5EU46_9DIPT